MDPYFDAVTAELRGFDLGDDDELLGKLVRQRAQSAEPLQFSHWLFPGVLIPASPGSSPGLRLYHRFYLARFYRAVYGVNYKMEIII